MAEFLVSNQITWVRFPSPAPELDFWIFDQPFRGRRTAPPIDFGGFRALHARPSGGSSRTLVRQQPFSQKGCYPLRFFQDLKRLLSSFPSVRANHSAFVQVLYFARPATSFRKAVLLFLRDIFLGLCPALNSHQEVAGALFV